MPKPPNNKTRANTAYFLPLEEKLRVDKAISELRQCFGTVPQMKLGDVVGAALYVATTDETAIKKVKAYLKNGL